MVNERGKLKSIVKLKTRTKVVQKNVNQKFMLISFFESFSKTDFKQTVFLMLAFI